MSEIQNSVVITGGNRGIGIGITESFLEAGYKVIVGARTKGDLESLATKNLIFYPMDVRDELAHQELAEIAINSTGGLNVWINNAGVSSWKPINLIEEFTGRILCMSSKAGGIGGLPWP